MRRGLFVFLGFVLASSGCRPSADTPVAPSVSASQAASTEQSLRVLPASVSGRTASPNLPSFGADLPRLPTLDDEVFPQLPPLPGEPGGPPLPQLPALPGEVGGPLLPAGPASPSLEAFPQGLEPAAEHGERPLRPVLPNLPESPHGELPPHNYQSQLPN